MRIIKPGLLLVSVIFAGSCGGEIAEDAGEFDSAVVYVTSVEPSTLTSDVISRITERKYVNTGTDCDTQKLAEDVCTGYRYLPDTVTINFKYEPLKDFRGDPVTELPSPVIIESIELSFTPVTSGCPSLGKLYSYPYLTLDSDTTDVSAGVEVASYEVKENILAVLGKKVNYIYVDEASGCETLFSVDTLDKVCTYRVDIKASAVEIYSGKRSSVRASMTLRLEEFHGPSDECRIK